MELTEHARLQEHPVMAREYEVLLMIHLPNLPVADVTWNISWARPVCAQHNLRLMDALQVIIFDEFVCGDLGFIMTTRINLLLILMTAKYASERTVFYPK